MLDPLLMELIVALQKSLSGVGPKTAQRMAFRLLERDRQGGVYLAETIQKALQNIRHCELCRMWCEAHLCPLCSNPNRDSKILCIVETPADVMAIEQTSMYRGRYFVLMGHLSPLDGIGPENIGLHHLHTYVEQSQFQEVIIATSHTVEGEATAHLLIETLSHFPLKLTRIAHGVPSGGEIEYIDSRTLADALISRTSIPSSEE